MGICWRFLWDVCTQNISFGTIAYWQKLFTWIACIAQTPLLHWPLFDIHSILWLWHSSLPHPNGLVFVDLLFNCGTITVSSLHTICHSPNLQNVSCNQIIDHLYGICMFRLKSSWTYTVEYDFKGEIQSESLHSPVVQDYLVLSIGKRIQEQEYLIQHRPN